MRFRGAPWFRFSLALLLIAGSIRSCFACSVLSHEALIDALWDAKLKPALLARFPGATPDDLKKAHGYAYGGSIIQDLGYYPHGSKQFSDLAHYVRTGDFVLALISESQSLNELAFALGAMSHYFSDVEVHRSATNPGEAILYPKLRRKFGNVVTYEEDPAAHLKTEFGFDVLEVAKARFAPEAYHDFIGFYVAQPVLDRAFRDTYGLALSDLFPNFERSIGSYRRVVSKVIPAATRIAWAQRHDELQRSEPGITRSRFVYLMRRSSYEHDWGKQYDRPTAKDLFLAGLLKLIPPIGPLRALRFKMPTPEVEKLFMQSFDRATQHYGDHLQPSTFNGMRLADLNYDIGLPVRPGSYKLEDRAYAFWLGKLAEKHFLTATPEIRQAVLTYYYQDPNAPIETKRHPKQWREVLTQLASLKARPLAGVVNGTM
jgi:Zinc dependent phospholipase C